nr:MAG TPA: tail tape measure protein [Caudoviricetes sp.]
MADETTRKIYDVKVNAGDAIKALVDLNAKSQELKKAQKELDLSTQEGAEAYYSYEAQIRDVSSQMSQYRKEIQNDIKAQRENEGSLKSLRAQLSNLNSAYDELSEADRTGKIGQEMQKQILAVTDTLKKAEGETGRFQRNVGDYTNSIIDGFSKFGGTTNQVINPIKNATSALKVMSQTPIIAILGVIVTVLQKVISSLKSSEDTMNRVRQAMSAFSGGAVILERVFQALGKGIAWVIEKLAGLADALGLVSEASKQMQQITKDEIALEKAERQAVLDNAKDRLRVSELKSQAAQKDKYTTQERIKALEDAAKIEKQIADRDLALAEQRFAILKKKAELTENDKETNDELARAEAELYGARQAYNERTRDIYGQLAEARNSLKTVTTASTKAEADAEKKSTAEIQKALKARLSGIKALIQEAQKSDTEAQVKEITDQYRKAIDDLSKLSKPIKTEGMSQEEYDELLKQYEDYEARRVEIAGQLEKALQDKVANIRKEGQDKLIKESDDAISKEYAERLAKASDNDRKRLTLENEALQKQIEARKKAGADTYNEETKLQANLRALKQLDLNTELIENEENARKVFEIRKAYLEAELAAVGDNADKEASIRKQLADSQTQEWQRQIDQFSQYSSKSQDLLSSFNSILSGLDAQRTQEIEQRYSDQEAALANSLEQGLITQEEYNARQVKADKEKEKELAKIERQQAIRDRIASLFKIAIDTATGIMQSVASSPLTGGLPWSAIVGAIGAAQAAAVLAQPLPQAAKGKYIQGPSHANGGVQLEVEGGEAVINKRSTSMFLPLLSALNQLGGGVPFTRPGSDGGYTIRSTAPSSAGITAGEMKNTIRDAFAEVKVVATIEDIRREDAKYVDIEAAGTF